MPPQELVRDSAPQAPTPVLSPLQMEALSYSPPLIDEEERRSSFEAILSQVSIPRPYTPTRPYHVDTLERHNSTRSSAASPAVASATSPLSQDMRPSPLAIAEAPTAVDTELISPVTPNSVQQTLMVPHVYPQNSITDLGLYPTYYSDPSSQVRRRYSASQETLTYDRSRLSNHFEVIPDSP
jgi:hypothetical protein